MTELTPAQAALLEAEDLRRIRQELRLSMIPDAQRATQALQRSLVVADREWSRRQQLKRNLA